MKKICKILLALVLVISLSSNTIVYAGSFDNNLGLSVTTKEKLNEQLFFLYLDAENFGMTPDNFDELYIGAPIHSYECIDCSLQELDFLSYPIFWNNKIILFMNERTDGEEASISLTQCYAEELTEYYLSGDAVALIYDAEKCYVMSEDDTQVISVFGYNIASRNNISECNLENIVLSELLPVENVEYTGLAARASYAYLAVPSVLQGDYIICWAASAACIGNYLTSYNYTAVDIAKAQHGEDFNREGGIYEADLRLQYTYDILYPYSSESNPLTDSTIYKNLIEGYPIYAKWTMSDGNYHAMVIRGILTDSYILIMDPNTGFCVVDKSGTTYSYVDKAGNTLTFMGYLAYYGY